MSQPIKFPTEQFRKAMTVTSELRKNIQPFVKQYKLNNMPWIFATIIELKQIFGSRQEDFSYKFNSIFVVKILLNSCETSLVKLIEIYLLQPLYQIASYQYKQGKSKSNYFIDLGYDKNTAEDFDKYSENYVNLATQLIYAGSIMKPKKLYRSQEITAKSQFINCYNKLVRQGLKPLDHLLHYKLQQNNSEEDKKKISIESLRKKFVENLSKLKDSEDQYVDYFIEFIQKKLTSNNDLAYFKPILFTGDVQISAQVTFICQDILLKNNNFKYKNNALQLLSQLVKWGDLNAYYIINQKKSGISAIVGNINEAKTDKLTLERGKYIYSEINNQSQEKQHFYQEFMKYLQMWALCFEKDLFNQEKSSIIYQLYIHLKDKRKLEFPVNKFALQYKKACLDAFKANQQRNKRIFQERSSQKVLDRNASGSDSKLGLDSRIEDSKLAQKRAGKKQASQLKQTPLDANVNITYNSFKKSINNSQQIIKSIPQSQKDLPQKMNALLKFKNNFETNIQNIVDVKQEELEQIIDEGYKVCDKINQLQKVYTKYQRNQMSFKHICLSATGQLNKSQLKSQIKSQIKPENASKFHDKKQEVNYSNKQLQRNSMNKQESPIKGNKQPENNSQNSIKKQETLLKEKLQKQLQSDLINNIKKQQEGKTNKSLHSLNKQNESKQNIPYQSQIHSLHSPVKFVESQNGSKYLISPPKDSKKLIEQQSMNRHRGQQQSIIQLKQTHHSHRKEKDSLKRNLKPQYQSQHKQKITIPQKPFGDNNDYMQFLPNRQKQDYIQVQREPIQAYRPNQFNLKANPSQSDKFRINTYEHNDYDYIQLPELSPLEQSFHDLDEIQARIQKQSAPTFKSCFSTDKFLISKNDKISKMSWLQNDTSSLFKPIKQSSNMSGSGSRVSLPQLLEQKNKKLNKQIQNISNQKMKQIQMLKQRLNRMQQSERNLNNKIYAKQQSIKSYQYNQRSQVGVKSLKNNYIEDQEYIYKNRDKFSSSRIITPKKAFTGFNDGKIQIYEPKGQLVHTRYYTQQYKHFITQKQKKSLLKQKQLLYKDNYIEIGSMTHREGFNLKVIIYITPEVQITNLEYIISESKLNITSNPLNFKLLQNNKQEKIIFDIKIDELPPYGLPNIIFSYKINAKNTQILVPIPCPFHKFVQVKKIDERDLQDAFKKYKVLRSQQIPYSRKILKQVSQIKEYLPQMSILNSGNQYGQVVYGGVCRFQKHTFYIKICVKPNQFLYILGASKDEISQAIVQNYISITSFLFMKELDERK